MGQYTVQVRPELQTQQMTIDLRNWEQNSSTVRINADTGDAVSSVQRLTDGAGMFATQITRGGQQIVNLVDRTREWSSQQDNLRDRISLSTIQLQRMSEVAGGLTDSWGRNLNGIDDVRNRIEALQSEYQALLNSSEALDSADVRRLNNQQREINETISLIRTQNQSMSSGIGNGVASFVAQYVSITKAIEVVTSTMRDMIEEVFELDSSLTELAKVSNIAKEDMGDLTTKAFELGDAIGRTGREVVDSVATFKQAGYTMEEAFDLGETALVMTNIADGMNDVSEASTNLVSIMKGFGLSTQESMHIADAFNNVNIDAFSYGNI